MTSLTPFECLELISNLEKSQFAFEFYRDRKKIYYEILLDENSKIVIKMDKEDYEALLNNEEVRLSDLALFTSEQIKGDIRIKEILHGGISENPRVSSFFKTYPNSKYQECKDLYPIGLTGGYVEILYKNDRKCRLKLEDVAHNFTGIYEMTLEDNKLILMKLPL